MSYNPFSLNGKTILVTGASSGIGRATATECSKMGATVLITGRNKERLAQTFEQLDNARQNVALAGELNDGIFIEELATSIASLDGVVFCAGVSDTTPMKFATREKIMRVFEIDFFSQVELIRNLLNKKKINKKASLVFISSVGATAPKPGLGIYSAAKSGLISIMKTLALELSPRGIRSNAVLPSMVKTPLIDTLGSLSAEDYAKDEARYLLGYGEPNDVAYTTIYLLSDASKWMTGSEIVIDGGLTLV